MGLLTFLNRYYKYATPTELAAGTLPVGSINAAVLSILSLALRSGARTFQSAAMLERSTAPKNSATPLFLHVAADWKVRAPFLQA